MVSLVAGEKFDIQAPMVNGGKVGVGVSSAGLGVWKTFTPPGPCCVPVGVEGDWHATSTTEMRLTATIISPNRFACCDILSPYLRGCAPALPIRASAHVRASLA